MPIFTVRVSRATWHSGNVEITAYNEERAVEHALEIADTVDLKDWGDTVDLSHLKDKTVDEVLIDGILQEAFVLEAQEEEKSSDNDRGPEEAQEEAGS